jgi:hypothetical protein
LRSWYLQPPSNLLVSLIEPSDAAAVHPQDVAVWVLGLVLVTVLNRNLRFTVRCQWNPTIRVISLYPTPPMPESTARRREELSFWSTLSMISLRPKNVSSGSKGTMKIGLRD